MRLGVLLPAGHVLGKLLAHSRFSRTTNVSLMLSNHSSKAFEPDGSRKRQTLSEVFSECLEWIFRSHFTFSLTLEHSRALAPGDWPISAFCEISWFLGTRNVGIRYADMALSWHSNTLSQTLQTLLRSPVSVWADIRASPWACSF